MYSTTAVAWLAARCATGEGLRASHAAACVQDTSADHITAQQVAVSYCFGCLRDLNEKPESSTLAAGPGVVVSCPDCKQVFCFECDAFIHETLHNCPGCQSGLQRPQTDDTSASMDMS